MDLERGERKLKELMKDWSSMRMQLPAFQRPYVWRIRQTLNLLDSIYRGYPISVLYLWEPSAESKMRPKASAFKSKEMSAQPRVFYVIDGQQRLTSLAAAFGLSEAVDDRGRSLECCFDLATEEDQEDSEQRRALTRLFKSPANTGGLPDASQKDEATLVWFREIIDGDEGEVLGRREEALKGLEGWTAPRVKAAMDRLRKVFRMLDVQVPCITIRDADDVEVVEIFKRLNRGGTGLRQGDVEAANLGIGASVEVLQQMREFVEGERAKRLGFSFPFAFRALVVFHRDNASYSKMSASWASDASPIHGGSVSASWKIASQAMNWALEFVDERLGWCRRAFLPSANALIPLAVALHRSDNQVSDVDVLNYRRWLCLAALRSALQSIESAMNSALRSVRNEQPSKSSFGLLHSLPRSATGRISPSELDDSAPLWGATTQVCFAWLTAVGAKDWESGKSLRELAQEGGPTSRTGRLSVHHIFPREVLSTTHESWEANWASNYAIISGSTNSKFSATRPDELLNQLDPEARKRAAVQFFDHNAGDRLRDFENFRTWRAEQLAKALNSWLELPIKK
jgi:hypothetical protein